MNRMERFISYLCGEFNNEQQFLEQKELGKEDFPKASHINQVCNQKIKNLPDDFTGYFVIEESYYEIGNRKNILPHLFLFHLNEVGKIVLTSYDLPDNVKKEDFRSDNAELVLDYNTLIPSDKFTPMIYEEIGQGFKGKSVSDFGNGLIFTLQEKTSEEGLEVSEVFERNEKKIFGFDVPIIYKRDKK